MVWGLNPIFRPLDAHDQDGCESKINLVSCPSPALVLITERVLCFLICSGVESRHAYQRDAGGYKTDCRDRSIKRHSQGNSDVNYDLSAASNPSSRSCARLTYQKTGNLQPLTLRLCMRERTVTARKIVAANRLICSCVVVRAFRLSGAQISGVKFPASERNGLGRNVAALKIAPQECRKKRPAKRRGSLNSRFGAHLQISFTLPVLRKESRAIESKVRKYLRQYSTTQYSSANHKIKL